MQRSEKNCGYVNEKKKKEKKERKESRGEKFLDRVPQEISGKRMGEIVVAAEIFAGALEFLIYNMRDINEVRIYFCKKIIGFV